ncbi:hypothetical protein B0T22DRAFT_515652 [Podospora appendiculata]|uniref:Uncharacterized protein n=1 Tax=Podospora appendiculata TaxID=314037 RepID=A0AAE0XCZ0_9PEZI|nr:hypothetical protein B0T22DRAFT_515652 [Podospora appendiculata]
MSQLGKRKRSPSPAPEAPRSLDRETIPEKQCNRHRTADRYPDTCKFAGHVFIEGNQGDPDWAIKKANKAAEHCATLDDLQLSVATDGSVSNDKARKGAGYSCVYTKHDLRNGGKAKRIEKDFYAALVGDNNWAEGLGVIEGIHSLIEMLQEASLLLPADAPVKAYQAVARVFSDSTSTLEAVEERRGPLNTNTTYEAIMQNIINMIIAKSHELQEIRGFDVRLELHWVPSHCGKVLSHDSSLGEQNQELSASAEANPLPQLPQLQHSQIEQKRKNRPFQNYNHAISSRLSEHQIGAKATSIFKGVKEHFPFKFTFRATAAGFGPVAMGHINTEFNGGEELENALHINDATPTTQTQQGAGETLTTPAASASDAPGEIQTSFSAAESSHIPAEIEQPSVPADAKTADAEINTDPNDVQRQPKEPTLHGIYNECNIYEAEVIAFLDAKIRTKEMSKAEITKLVSSQTAHVKDLASGQASGQPESAD